MHGPVIVHRIYKPTHKKSQVFVYNIAFLSAFTTAIFILFLMIKSQTSSKIQKYLPDFILHIL